MATEPEYVGAAGDWHRHYQWSAAVVRNMCKRLRELGETHPIILQAGDFGYYDDPGGTLQRIILSDLLEQEDGEVWFVDGNHENHEGLRRLIEGTEDLGRVPIPCLESKRIFWLPRGYRWKWHGRTWLALGGAASINRADLTPGLDWFPEETISLRDAAVACAPGHADVMLTHDAPAWVKLRMSFPQSMWDPADIRASEQHRELMTRITEEIDPQWLIHGHYHTGRPEWRTHHGVQVASLPENGNQNNCGILNVRTMEWV